MRYMLYYNHKLKNKQEDENMRTNEIIREIDENGGFYNFRGWTQKEIAEWVYSNYPCSRYVAKSVAFYLS